STFLEGGILSLIQDFSLLFQCSFLLFILETGSYFVRPCLECSGAIISDCSLPLLDLSASPTSRVAGITGMHHHAWLILYFLVEIGFRHVGEADLELLTSCDLPTSASQSVGITGVSHCAQLVRCICKTVAPKLI
uniref:Uncharacterized protein n=1 Tax=Papio anubis TaxID=9555 RepID=A0A8I5N4R4_PAPAN